MFIVLIYIIIGFFFGSRSIVDRHRDLLFYFRLLLFLLFWPAIVILALYVGGIKEVKRMLGLDKLP